MRIIMMGPPGAGKGTQAKLLAEALRVPHISTGDIFRSARADSSPLGEKVSDYLDRGDLVPDDLTVDVVKRRMSEKDCEDGYILDGFPRSVLQAERLEESLQERQDRLTRVINIQVGEREIVERLTARRSCGQCGAVYNLLSSPAEREGKCDVCGGDLVLREDDKEETIRRRLRVYEEETEPLLKFYEARDLLVTVDGERESAEVTAEIMRRLSR
jgi:adenylate kinase